MSRGGVQVEVRYYTIADVLIGKFIIRHHFKVLEIVPDVVLGLPWLRSKNPTFDWKEWYADIRHRSTSYRLSFDESRDSTQLHFQAPSKLDLLSKLSSSTSTVSRAGSPTPPAKECTDYARRHVAQMMQTQSISPRWKMVSPMRSAATWKSSTSRCRSLGGRSVKLTSLVMKCLCAACSNPRCQSIKCTTCKIRVTMTSLTQFDASCLFENTNGHVFTTRKEQRSENCLRINLEDTMEYASTLKTILRGYTITKWTQANCMSLHDSWTSCTDLAEFDHPQVDMERVAC